MAKTAEAGEVKVTAKETKEKTVKITLPLPPIGEAKTQFVGVNGKTYLLEKGVEVEVPISVAEVLENSEAMKKEARDRIEKAVR